MSHLASDFKIGVFILGALAVLTAGVLVFGGARFFQDTVTEETYVVGNVNGLGVGAPVTLRGVRVGRVTDIEFTWSRQATLGYVRIQFEVLARTYPVSGKALAKLIQAQVDQGLRARVETQGLIGSPLLALEYVNPAEYPPPPLPWTPQHLYIPSAPSQFNELLASMEKSLGKLSQLDLAALSTSLERDLNAGNTLLEHLNAVEFSQLGTNANALVTELRELSTKLQSAVGDLTGTVKRMDLEEAARNANTLLLQLQATVHKLDIMLANVDIGSVNETLANVRQASTELQQALHELRQYPAGFILGTPPPPAKGIVPSH